MSIKQDIEETYEKFNKLFISSLDKSLKELQMSQIRNQFKEWLDSEDSIFHDATHAEDVFLYVYHFTELQEIKRRAVFLRELSDEKKYLRFIQEFFDDNSPSGLQDLKVHQLNDESDKGWFSRAENSDEIIHLWREERFSAYL